MADEAAPVAEKSEVAPKMFNLKAIIVFAVIMVFYTIGLFYYLKGSHGKASHEETSTSTNNLKMFSRLVIEESEIPPIKIAGVIVPIKLDKNGDTSKLLSCGLAFQLGLTLKEQKAIDENKWPPMLESTRFGHNISEEEYAKPEWSLKDEIVGKAGEGGGHGGGSAKGPIADSYIGLLTNLEVDLRAKILNTLMQTTYSQINTDDGKNQICEQLKNEANAMLKNLGKYPRVKKVQFIEFVPPQ